MRTTGVRDADDAISLAENGSGLKRLQMKVKEERVEAEPQLNLTKTDITSTEERHNFNENNEGIEIGRLQPRGQKAWKGSNDGIRKGNFGDHPFMGLT